MVSCNEFISCIITTVSFRGEYLDMAKYFGSLPKRVVDFHSDWALCSSRFASATEQSFLGAFDEPFRFRVSGQYDVGHEGVITGCDAFSLRSSIADPQGVAQSERRSTIYIVDVLTKK